MRRVLAAGLIFVLIVSLPSHQVLAGLSWMQAEWTSAPSARDGHSLTSAGGKIVLFGGYGASGFLGDTWVYDPQTETWSQAAAGPSARYGHAAAASGGKVYVFGGYGSGYALVGDFWEFSPAANQWLQLSGTLPGPRAGAAMASDQKGNLWLFGGQGVNGYLSDFWRFDVGTGVWIKTDEPYVEDNFSVPDTERWVLSEDAAIVSGYLRLTRAVNAVTGKAMLSGQVNPQAFEVAFRHWAGGGSGADETAVFFGANENINITPSGLCVEAGSGYWLSIDEYLNNPEPTANNLHLIRCQNGSWSYIGGVSLPFDVDSGTWRAVKVRVEDARLRVWIDGELYWDFNIPNYQPAGFRFGFLSRTGGLSNEHRVDDVRVVRDLSVPAPPQRAWHGLAAGGDGRLYLFGGVGPFGLLSDTWVYDPAAGRWSQIQSSGPSARYWAAVASAPDGSVVLFGGQAGPGHYFGDTWRLDPSAGVWAQEQASGPSARAGAALVGAGSRLLLFGGTDNSFLGDGWFLDGFGGEKEECPPSRTSSCVAVSALVGEDLSLELSPSLVDFGAVHPSGSPYERASAAAAVVRSNVPWTLLLFGTPPANGSSSLPLWHQAPGGQYAPLSASPAAIASGQDTAGTVLLMNYLLEVPFSASPGPHQGAVVYEIIPL